jgi:hypothetical protein
MPAAAMATPTTAAVVAPFMAFALTIPGGGAAQRRNSGARLTPAGRLACEISGREWCNQCFEAARRRDERVRARLFPAMNDQLKYRERIGDSEHYTGR